MRSSFYSSARIGLPNFSFLFFSFSQLILGCTESLLLCVGFLWLQRSGAVLDAGPGLPLLLSTGSRARGLQQLRHTDLVVPWHVGSSPPRDQTRVPCFGRWSVPLSHQGGLRLFFLRHSYILYSLAWSSHDFSRRAYHSIDWL